MVRPHAISGVQALIKYALDVVLSAVALFLLLPVFIIITLLIKLISTGPVFFTQERVGLNKNRFRMIKFRTPRRNRLNWSS